MKLDIMEALRYLGAGSSPPEVLRRDMEQIADQLTAAVRPRYAYRVFSTVHEERGVLLREAGILLTGRSAARMLAQCDQAVLLICTLGAGFETMLRAEQARDMARAVMLLASKSTSLGVFMVMAGTTRKRSAPKLPVKILLFSKLCSTGRKSSSITPSAPPFHRAACRRSRAPG